MMFCGSAGRLASVLNRFETVATSGDMADNSAWKSDGTCDAAKRSHKKSANASKSLRSSASGMTLVRNTLRLSMVSFPSKAVYARPMSPRLPLRTSTSGLRDA